MNMPWTKQDNPYLGGNFAPVADELTVENLAVEGELPKELCGRYLRNGPNPITSPKHRTYHWFMGDGMVHGICLRDGRAQWYRNRYVGSKQVSRQRAEADVCGPNWNKNPIGPNTNVAGFAGTTWATVEAGGCPVELSYELETLGRNDFFGTLPGAFTAHPKFDPVSQELHAMVYAWAEWRDHVQYVVVGKDGKVRRSLDVPLPGMSMMHDMSLTTRYSVIYDQPVTVSMKLAMIERFPFRWDPSYGNRVGLLPREGSADDIIWIDAPLGYSFHPMNAFDDANGDVVIDLCVYDRMFDNDTAGPFGDSMARLERWTLNPSNRSIATQVVDERANEFPRHRDSVATQAYRYGYTVAPSADPGNGWPTLKHDLHSGERWSFDHGAGRAAGESVFVAKEGGSAEDDGWLLAFIHDLKTESTEFVVMDAADFDRGYVAKIVLPQRAPFGFHGNWVSDRSVPPSS